MSQKEVETLLEISKQYLNPKYDENAPGGIKAQQDQEEGLFALIVGILSRKDQDVLKLWKIIKKKRK